MEREHLVPPARASVRHASHLFNYHSSSFSVRQRIHVQPLHREPKGVVPRVAPGGVHVQPPADAVPEVDVGGDDALAVLPLRAGQDVAEGRDDAGAAAGQERGGLGGLGGCRLGGCVPVAEVWFGLLLGGGGRGGSGGVAVVVVVVVLVLGAAEDNLVAVVVKDALAAAAPGDLCGRVAMRESDLEAIFGDGRAPPTGLPGWHIVVHRRITTALPIRRRTIYQHTTITTITALHRLSRAIVPAAPHAHVARDDEAAALDADGAHQPHPGVAGVGGGRQVQVDVLGVEGLAQQRHVVLPADGGGEVDAHAAHDGGDGAERAGAALRPDEAL